MHAAVIGEHARLIEPDGRALSAVEPDIEWPAWVARRGGVELCAHVHERDSRTGGHAELVRPEGPRGLLARRLDDLDLVGPERWPGRCGAARREKGETEARRSAEGPAEDHDDRTCVEAFRMRGRDAVRHQGHGTWAS